MLRNKMKEERLLRDIRGVEGRFWNENVFAPPNGLREEAATVISCRDLDLPERRKRYTTSSREEGVDGTTIESRTHIVQ